MHKMTKEKRKSVIMAAWQHNGGIMAVEDESNKLVSYSAQRHCSKMMP
jgi:hypothetical protein